MFKKLRNRLIWINLGITTIVIVTAFTAIYIFATQSANKRPPEAEPRFDMISEEMENYVQITIEHEREAAARDLLVTLIISGVVIELAVALVSYYLAEQAIKPIRDAYESQKIFIANASHEIKTPLAAISANLEAADIHGNKWIKNVELETEKLSALNSQLLTLARTDLGSGVSTEDVDLKKYIEELIRSFEPRLGKKKLTKRIVTRGKVIIAKADFAQIFGILMDNAIKYSDKIIELHLDEHALTISNDGTIIKTDDLAKIFDRFYQVDKSAEGVGLGLSIAKSLADRNGWELSANSTKTMTNFVLKF